MKRKTLLTILATLCLGTACLGLAACGDKPNPTPGPDDDPGPDSEIEQVVDYKLDVERTYTGGLKDGKPEGEGVIRYANGDKLEATFTAGDYSYGTFTYANTMHYTGGFQNGQFHGEGLFDWRTYNADGSMLGDGWLYEGQFQNGTMVGCYGKITFNAGRGSNLEGIHWFEGEMNAFPGLKPNQQGKGYILFGDKSTYEGDLYYNGHDYLRYGVGEQNFFDTTFTGGSAGSATAPKIWSYVGEFDGVNYSWMFGNGVMYFCDMMKNPVGYIRGYWNGLTRMGGWSGEWSDDMLLENWKDTPELTYMDAYSALFYGYMNEYQNVDLTGKTLMIGDSQFAKEFNAQSSNLMGDLNPVNIAIGGTTSVWWRGMLGDLILGEPEYLLVHIGGNDLRVGNSLAKAIKDTQELLVELTAKYPNAKLFYVPSIIGVSDYQGGLAANISQLNAAMKTYCAEHSEYTFIDALPTLYSETGKGYHENGYGYIRSELFKDNLHLTEAGYTLWMGSIKEQVLGWIAAN